MSNRRQVLVKAETIFTRVVKSSLVKNYGCIFSIEKDPDIREEFIEDASCGECSFAKYDFSDAPSGHPLRKNDDIRETEQEAFAIIQKVIDTVRKECGFDERSDFNFGILDSSGADGYLGIITKEEYEHRKSSRSSYSLDVLRDTATMDFIDDVPKPTHEEGSHPLTEPIDLDNKEPEPGNVDITIDIEENRDETRTHDMKLQKEKMLEVLHALEVQLAVRRTGYAGQEGFTDAVKNGLTGIVNILGHITNLFSTALFHGWRDFKRSELTAYSDSNRLTMTRLYGLSYFEIQNVKVPTPQGMEGKYVDALNSLNEYLTTLNMLKRSTKMLKMVEAIYADMRKTNTKFASHIQDVNRNIQDKYVEQLFEKTGKFFTSKKHTDKVAFSSVFGSTKDFEYCVKTCMDMDTHLRSVASVHSRLMDINDVVSNIIDHASVLNTRQIDDLVKMTRMFAEYFDQFATVINDVNRVNHNLVFVIKALRNYTKM